MEIVTVIFISHFYPPLAEHEQNATPSPLYAKSNHNRTEPSFRGFRTFLLKGMNIDTLGTLC
jgi:hypothetical protein